MGRARALAAPQVVLGCLVDDVAPRPDDEQRVEVAVLDDLGPPGLALDDDVGLVLDGELAQHLGLRTGDFDVEVPGRRHVRDVEHLVGEAGQRTLGQAHQLHGQVDVHRGDAGVDAVDDRIQVAGDVVPLAGPVDDGREPDRVVRRDGLRLLRRC